MFCESRVIRKPIHSLNVRKYKNINRRPFEAVLRTKPTGQSSFVGVPNASKILLSWPISESPGNKGPSKSIQRHQPMQTVIFSKNNNISKQYSENQTTHCAKITRQKHSQPPTCQPQFHMMWPHTKAQVADRS